jgi:hypothetical protein
MSENNYSIELDEKAVIKLPYCGPPSRRIYILLQQEESTFTKELFVQRADAFATNLSGLLNGLKNREISEIRYSCGFDGLIRIYLDGRGKLLGEYHSKSEKTLQEMKRRLDIK